MIVYIAIHKKFYRLVMGLIINILLWSIGVNLYTSAVYVWHERCDAVTGRINDLEKSYYELYKMNNRISYTVDSANRIMHVGDPSALTLQSIAPLLIDASDKHNIKNLKISRKPWKSRMVQEEEGFVVFRSKLNISFNSLTDIDGIIFALSLLDKCPGYLDVTSIDLRRIREFGPDYVQDIKNHKTSGAIKMDIQIQWYVLQAPGDKDANL